MTTPIATWRRILALLAVFGLVLAACGDDGDDGGTGDTVPAGDETPSEDDTPDEGAAGETVEITGVDFGYEGVPDSVTAGTTLSLVNASDSELHEIVAILLPEDEERSVEELLQLPEEELFGILGPNVTDVILALPNATDTPGAVEGDGVLDEAGRYALVCFIPSGIDPQVYLDAAQEAEGGPPEVEGGGPPHFTQGMFTELTVEG